MTIIVPYRSREDHLNKFIPHMRAYLPDARIVVVEQADDKPFNRGKLLNIGVLESRPDFFALHDIDKLPIQADYSEPVLHPRQLADNKFQTVSYFGGVTLFSADHFKQIDGFRNDFWGWGGEDNELLFQLGRMRIPPVYKFGMFADLPHPRPKTEFNAYRWRTAQQRRPASVGLRNCEYNFVSSILHKDYTHIKVEL